MEIKLRDFAMAAADLAEGQDCLTADAERGHAGRCLRPPSRNILYSKGEGRRPEEKGEWAAGRGTIQPRRAKVLPVLYIICKLDILLIKIREPHLAGRAVAVDAPRGLVGGADLGQVGGPCHGRASAQAGGVDERGGQPLVVPAVADGDVDLGSRNCNAVNIWLSSLASSGPLPRMSGKLAGCRS